MPRSSFGLLERTTIRVQVNGDGERRTRSAGSMVDHDSEIDVLVLPNKGMPRQGGPAFEPAHLEADSFESVFQSGNLFFCCDGQRLLMGSRNSGHGGRCRRCWGYPLAAKKNQTPRMASPAIPSARPSNANNRFSLSTADISVCPSQDSSRPSGPTIHFSLSGVISLVISSSVTHESDTPSHRL